jgi:hypothetical protein
MSQDPVCYTRMLYGHPNVLSCCDIRIHYVMYPLQTSTAIRQALANLNPDRIRARQFISNAIDVPWLHNDDSTEPALHSQAKSLVEGSDLSRTCWLRPHDDCSW